MATNQKCTNCAHFRCMFHGEDRAPVYQILAQCWVDPEGELGQRLKKIQDAESQHCDKLPVGD